MKKSNKNQIKKIYELHFTGNGPNKTVNSLSLGHLLNGIHSNICKNDFIKYCFFHLSID